MKNTNFIAIDFETATPKREPCQIGIVVVKEGIITERISRLIQPPENRYSEQCTNVHGITPEDTIDTPEFNEVWEDIKKYFEGNFVIAHNLSFDLNVLDKALDSYDIPHPIFMGTACTYQLSGLSLEKACNEYNVELCNHHNGECDAEACANLFIKYLNGEFHSQKSKDNTDMRGSLAPMRDSENEEFVNSEYLTIEKVRYFNKVGYEKFLDECACNDPFSCFTEDVLNSVPVLSKFEGKRFIITGGTVFNREQAYEIIKRVGGKKVSAINKSLDYAIIGEAPGPKKIQQLDELKEDGYDIKIITDLEFVSLLKSSLNNILNAVN